MPESATYNTVTASATLAHSSGLRSLADLHTADPAWQSNSSPSQLHLTLSELHMACYSAVMHVWVRKSRAVRYYCRDHVPILQCCTALQHRLGYCSTTSEPMRRAHHDTSAWQLHNAESCRLAHIGGMPHAVQQHKAFVLLAAGVPRIDTAAPETNLQDLDQAASSNLLGVAALYVSSLRAQTYARHAWHTGLTFNVNDSEHQPKQ
jgi:hypothetical protein